MHAAFDIGNVLCEVDFSKFTKELSYMISSNTKSDEFLENIQCLQDIGFLTLRQALRQHLHIKNETAIDTAIQAWNASVIPNEMMLRFLENIKSEGVKVALLSNIGTDHSEYLQKICPELFKDNVEHLSCEVGARKPSKAYFQSFLTDHDDFTGAIYLDDREENLKAGRKYRFKTIKFCLDEILTYSKSKQKKELERIKSYILNRMYFSPTENSNSVQEEI